MPVTPMSLLEFRMKREERKLSKLDLKKAKVDLEKTYAQVTDSDTLLARTVQRIFVTIFSVLPIIIIACCIDGMFKDYYDQRQVSKCEQYVTQNHLVANCANGIIGKTTPDGK